MAAQKQSRLDVEGLDYRNTKLGKDIYRSEINEYDGNNDRALAHDDEKHPHGKGTGVSMTYTPRNLSAPKQEINYKNLDTHSRNAGGSYDKYGTEGVEKAFQGKAGRENLYNMNIYNPDRAYGKDSVDIDTSVKGQFVVKD